MTIRDGDEGFHLVVSDSSMKYKKKLWELIE